MNKAFIIATAILILVIIGLSMAVSCQASRAKDAQIEALESELEKTRSEFMRMRSEIDEANRRIDEAVSVYAKGVRNAKEGHARRIEMLSEVDGDARDWLCEPVPDDVCGMFDGYAMCTDN